MINLINKTLKGWISELTLTLTIFKNSWVFYEHLSAVLSQALVLIQEQPLNTADTHTHLQKHIHVV